jgi:drug/metabolite transporter (DMT)-like permease
MLSSFVGIVVLSTGSGDVANGNVTLGIAGCIVAAACYGLFSVLNKKTDYNPNISMMIMWLTVSLCSIGLGLFTEEWVMIKGSQWLGLIWLGVVVDAVAYLLWAKALKGADDSSKIANLAYLTPFLSIIVSAIVLKEEITLRALIALLFIVGGILFPTFFEFVKKKANK